MLLLWRFFCSLSFFLGAPVVQSFAVSSLSSSQSTRTAKSLSYSSWTTTRLHSTPVEPPIVESVSLEPEATAEEPSSSSSPSSATAAVPATPISLGNTYVRCANCQTVYAITKDDIGTTGRRLECSLCGHAWYQSQDRIMTLNTNEMVMVDLSQRELDRIEMNRQEGKPLKFLGDKKLYIGNVAFEAHEEDFFKVFSQYGIVGDVSLVRDETGKIKGFGFITMRTAEGAAIALQKADGMSIRGREVAVRESMT